MHGKSYKLTDQDIELFLEGKEDQLSSEARAKLKGIKDFDDFLAHALHPTPEQISDYVLGDMPAAQQELIAQHVAMCTSCQEDVDASRKFFINAGLMKAPDTIIPLDTKRVRNVPHPSTEDNIIQFNVDTYLPKAAGSQYKTALNDNPESIKSITIDTKTAVFMLDIENVDGQIAISGSYNQQENTEVSDSDITKVRVRYIGGIVEDIITFSAFHIFVPYSEVIDIQLISKSDTVLYDFKDISLIDLLDDSSG